MPVNTRSADVFREELQTARPREFGRRRVITCAMIAVEAVVGIIDIDCDFRVRLLDLVYIAERNVRVFCAEVHDDWTTRVAIQLTRNAAAVIGTRRTDAG